MNVHEFCSCLFAVCLRLSGGQGVLIVNHYIYAVFMNMLFVCLFAASAGEQQTLKNSCLRLRPTLALATPAAVPRASYALVLS